MFSVAAVTRTQLDLSKFLNGFSLSLFRVTMAYLASLVLAMIFAILTVSSRKTETLILPVIDLAQSFPTFALLPILVHNLGASSASVIAILVVAMVWPITFSLIGGIKEQPREQAEAAHIFGATGWRWLWFYRWPMLQPSLVSGSIVSWGQAWDTIVGAEIIAGVFGAGHYLGDLGSNGQTGILVIGIALYLLLIFCMNEIIWLPLLHRATRYASES
jgi:NitT/TauT family transport system permease protein